MRKSKATEALRVATDIAAIRTALKKRGYTIRKQPKQVPFLRGARGDQNFYPLSA